MLEKISILPIYPKDREKARKLEIMLNWHWEKHKDEITKEWEEAQPWGVYPITWDKEKPK